MRKGEDDWWERLNHVLGTQWTKSEIIGLGKKGGGPNSKIDKVFIPLSLLLNPDIAKGLAKSFGGVASKAIADGEYIPEKGEEIVDMGDWSKEEFLASLKGAGVGGIPGHIAPARVPNLDIPNDPATRTRMAKEIEKGRKK